MRIVLKIKIFFLTILIVLSVSTFCHAEISNSSSAIKASAPQEVRFTHLTSKNGLSSDETMSVVQDNRGFIWDFHTRRVEPIRRLQLQGLQK
jgi:hypothetical protein